MSIKESVIRKMTRLAIQYKAVNLSQGFPNEGPPWKLRLALAHGVLSGQSLSALDETSTEQDLKTSIMDLLTTEHMSDDHSSDEGGALRLDQINQYSPPMGRSDVRQAIADYYQRFYQYEVSPDHITVTLGATEAFASALRTVGRPGDKCVILEPFHELYPAQCAIFYLEPIYVTLKDTDGTSWGFDTEELEDALRQAKILMLNSPHNPTGKVFSNDELAKIVELCIKHSVTIITDEIYEHMCFDHAPQHKLIPKEFPGMMERTVVCNSLGKSASATGWRLGWALTPPHLTEEYRGIHDQMCVMSPHPMQVAAMEFMTLPDSYFDALSRRYQRRVERLADALRSVGFRVVFPQGAYYLFVNFRNVPALAGMDSMAAAMYLLQTVGVACVPGDNFYGRSDDGANYLRFAACRSDDDLEEAIRRLHAKLG